ncbi:hypothetical protein L1987_11004 [Smallanthus sonchifolius]|uniref:Uncharacterized protein n=1 Tax=Smallanthus sonchifolius TaxID=185202 RepID=A0ACB9JAB4_9ASTR|nr:hypothetical protein L1987_11004 [Smallanthus sonchifolius]
MQDPDCGYPGFELSCNNSSPVLRISDINFTVKNIEYENCHVRLQLPEVLSNQTDYDYCPLTITNLTLDPNRFMVDKEKTARLLLFSNCLNKVSSDLERYRIRSCEKSEYVMAANDGNLSDLMVGCGSGKVVEMLAELDGGDGRSVVVDGGNYTEVVKKGFELRWQAADCGVCESSGGRCGFNKTAFQFRCFCPDRPRMVSCKTEKPRKTNRKLIVIAVVAASVLVFVLATTIFFIRRSYKRKASAYFSSKDKSRELEDASVYFGVPVFSYAELQDATQHFDSSKELGDGGFGTVYYGKLRDGREVAVKRLYEHNHKRLISSMLAFDISRSRDEINLANMAINRIQRCTLDELIDPFLGSDPETEKMTTSVAELAFRCLQFDLEMRPTMNEVLEVLKGIQVEGSGDAAELTVLKSEIPPPSPENDGVGLLKGMITASPISVTAKWHSTSSGLTTPNTNVYN